MNKLILPAILGLALFTGSVAIANVGGCGCGTCKCNACNCG